MKKAIAMKCTQEDFKTIELGLQKAKLKMSICIFGDNNYLTNRFCRVENNIANISFVINGEEIHETFNAKIFLDACGIETKPKYEITKEQILKIHDTCERERGYMGMNQIKDMFPDAFKKELVLEVGKWYVRKNNPKCIINYSGNEYNYGFGCIGNWSDGWALNNENKDSFRKATPKEVETALVNEAKKRGFIKGAIFKSIDYNLEEVLKIQLEDYCVFVNSMGLRTESNTPFRNIYKNGIWATIIPSKKMTLSEIETALGHKVEIV